MDWIKPTLGLLTVLLLFSPVSAIANTSVTTHLDNSGTTPFAVWFTAAILGAGLFLYTLRSRTQTSELEADAIVSVIAWVPIGFTALTSFSVDRIVSSFATSDATGYTILENHIIYHFDIIGVLYGIGVLVAIINTIRIISLHKTLKLRGEQQV